MSVQSIDHVYLETRRFEKALAFWIGLGFEVTTQWGEDGHRACRLDSDRAGVVLAEVPVDAEASSPGVFMEIRDPEELSLKLAGQESVEVITGLEDTHWGTRWIRVRDPDGNTWALEHTGK